MSDADFETVHIYIKIMSSYGVSLKSVGYLQENSAFYFGPECVTVLDLSLEKLGQHEICGRCGKR